MRRFVISSLAIASLGVSSCASLPHYGADKDGSYCDTHSDRCVLGGLLLVGGLIALAIAASDDDSSGPPVVVSDARLKTDLVRVGETPQGLPVYTYLYLGGTERFSGVLAQDVLARPELAHAVVKGEHGYLRVDYAALGLEVVNAKRLADAGNDAIAVLAD